MATEISNGKQTVKHYHSVNRGKAMFQLAYYTGGRRVQKNFKDKSEAKRVARAILGRLAEDAVIVDILATAELKSLVAARKVLASGHALHVAVEELMSSGKFFRSRGAWKLHVKIVKRSETAQGFALSR